MALRNTFYSATQRFTRMFAWCSMFAVCVGFGPALVLAQGNPAISPAQGQQPSHRGLCQQNGLPSQQNTLLVAVASNFALPMEELAQQFESETGCELRLSKGSTGSIYGQIRNGAPYEIFFAADQQTPLRLVQEGLADQSTLRTYAVGQLALWRRFAEGPPLGSELLKSGQFNRLAVANAQLAPYGRAALETLNGLQMLDAVHTKLVFGENIGQTFQFAASGNADLAFVALSQIMRKGKLDKGAAWLVPQSLYKPIRQDLVVLNKAYSLNKEPIASALLKYLESDHALAILEAYGYQPHTSN